MALGEQRIVSKSLPPPPYRTRFWRTFLLFANLCIRLWPLFRRSPKGLQVPFQANKRYERTLQFTVLVLWLSLKRIDIFVKTESPVGSSPCERCIQSALTLLNGAAI